MGARACLAPTHLFPGNLDSSIMSSCNTRVWGRDSRLRPASSGFVNIEWKRRQQMWVHKTSKKVARLVKLHVEIQFFYAPGSFKSLLSPFFSAASSSKIRICWGKSTGRFPDGCVRNLSRCWGQLGLMGPDVTRFNKWWRINTSVVGIK